MKYFLLISNRPPAWQPTPNRSGDRRFDKCVRRSAPLRAQRGSARSIVVLAIVAAVVWWQWDAISDFLGSMLSMGDSQVAEVLDYRCERQADGRAGIDGRIRNASNAPIAFRVVTAVYDSSGKKSEYSEADVRPSPLQPGQDGLFQTTGPALPDGGYCKLDKVLDANTGRPVKVRR